MPPEQKKRKVKARGVSNRNKGMEWLRENYVDTRGVVYFADDDNTYDLRLFGEVSTLLHTQYSFMYYLHASIVQFKKIFTWKTSLRGKAQVFLILLFNFRKLPSQYADGLTLNQM